VMVTNAKNYHKVLVQDSLFTDMFGQGLLLLEDDLHRQHRKMIQPLFNYSQLRSMLPIFSSKALNMVEKWNKNLEKNPQFSLELSGEMSNLTLDVIGEAAFGYQIGALEDHGDLIQSFKTLMSSLTLSVKRLIPMYSKMPFKDAIASRKASETIKSLVHKIISNKQKLRETQSEQQVDLLGLLLDAKDEDDGTRLTNTQLHHHALTFVLAGHETTSVAMSWVLYLLSQHPQVEEKVIEEINTILGERTDFTMEEVEKLTYLDHVIKETMRVYPPVPIVTRKAVNDDTLAGYHIPAGTKIVLCPGAIHKLDTYWENPLEFRPERWETADQNQYSFMPFLVGPRGCIGNKFAMLEMKTLLPIILRNFKVALVPGTKVGKKLSVTLKPHPGLSVNISHRKAE